MFCRAGARWAASTGHTATGARQFVHHRAVDACSALDDSLWLRLHRLGCITMSSLLTGARPRLRAGVNLSDEDPPFLNEGAANTDPATYRC